MAPPKLSKQLRKDVFAAQYKALPKPALFSESPRPSSLAPNIRSLSWSPTGSLVATSLSAHIRIWNPEKPTVKSSTELRNAGGVGMVEKIAFCPTHDALLASTGADATCRLWDVRLPGGPVSAGKGSKLAECKVDDFGLFLTWHPAGTELLVGRKDDVVMAVDVRRTGEPSATTGSALWEMHASDRTPEKDSGQFNAMAFSNSGRELFVTTGDGPVKILDYPSLDPLHTLAAHSSATNAVQHSPAGNFIAAGGNDSLVTLWDTADWHCAHALTGHAASVRALSFTFDGAYLVASSGTDARDGAPGIQITHVETGDHVCTIDTQNPVTWAAWHPLRYWLAYAGDPGGLKIVGAGSTI